MPVMTFTPAFMASGLVCPPDKKKIEYGVADEPGLFVECRASEKAVPTWYLRLKNEKGTNIYEKLGTIKDVGLVQAKKLAKQFKAEHLLSLKLGRPPALPVEITLDEFMCKHYMPHAEMHKRSAVRDEQLYRIRIAPKFGHLPLSKINRHEVQVFHVSLVKEHGLSPASADLHVALFRHALALAMEWEMLEKNVLRGFKLFHVDNRVENYLNDAEVERLKDVLMADSNRMVSLAILFLLVTGARLNSALHAKWRDVDLPNGVWLVPATEAKSKRANPQYLNPSALWILDAVGTRGSSEYVFVNRQTGKPFTTITRVWYRLRKEAGLNDRVRLHDLRHTFGRMVLAAGHSITELQRAMNHADCRTTQRYGHLTGTTMRTVALAASVIVKPVEAVPA